MLRARVNSLYLHIQKLSGCKFHDPCSFCCSRQGSGKNERVLERSVGNIFYPSKWELLWTAWIHPTGFLSRGKFQLEAGFSGSDLKLDVGRTDASKCEILKQDFFIQLLPNPGNASFLQVDLLQNFHFFHWVPRTAVIWVLPLNFHIKPHQNTNPVFLLWQSLTGDWKFRGASRTTQGSQEWLFPSEMCWYTLHAHVYMHEATTSLEFLRAKQNAKGNGSRNRDDILKRK